MRLPKGGPLRLGRCFLQSLQTPLRNTPRVGADGGNLALLHAGSNLGLDEADCSVHVNAGVVKSSQMHQRRTGEPSTALRVLGVRDVERGAQKCDSSSVAPFASTCRALARKEWRRLRPSPSGASSSSSSAPVQRGRTGPPERMTSSSLGLSEVDCSERVHARSVKGSQMHQRRTGGPLSPRMVFGVTDAVTKRDDVTGGAFLH